MHFCTFYFHLQDFDLRVLANAREPDATICFAYVEVLLLLCHMCWDPTQEDEKDIRTYQTFSTATARRRTGLFNADKTLKKTQKWTHRWALAIKCRSLPA
ncbi:hypothetical protein BYT27DRAFT_7181330 [Phlegmacium glaucopus]|nr:hypothetical protein BYT27DRAFT_7181330 [Phlegmacium glaucopus]